MQFSAYDFYAFNLHSPATGKHDDWDVREISRLDIGIGIGAAFRPGQNLLDPMCPHFNKYCIDCKLDLIFSQFAINDIAGQFRCCNSREFGADRFAAASRRNSYLVLWLDMPTARCPMLPCQPGVRSWFEGFCNNFAQIVEFDNKITCPKWRENQAETKHTVVMKPGHRHLGRCHGTGYSRRRILAMGTLPLYSALSVVLVDKFRVLAENCEMIEIIDLQGRLVVFWFSRSKHRIRWVSASHTALSSWNQFISLPDVERKDAEVCLLVGCLTSQQQASVSQGRICSDNFTCCHTEIEVADQTFYLTQSQYTDTGPTSPSADSVTPGAW